MYVGDAYATWNERAARVMPGPQSNFRVPFKFQPAIVEYSKGCRHIDIEGREFIDFLLGGGVGIFGTGYEPYSARLKEQIDDMLYLSPALQHGTKEVELAEELVKLIPCAEKVRFCQSATEAIQLAIRLGRAFTGKSLFIRFDGHYHGGMDNVLGGLTPRFDRDERPFPLDSAVDPRRTEGRSKFAFQDSFKIPWGDLECLQEVLKRYHEEVALIIMEPVLCSMGACYAPPGYLEAVRRLADQYGVLLCFDEVITGFRMGLGGAQEKLGIVPDIAIFGKALGAGIPLAVLAGKAEILNQLADCRVTGGGTYNAFPLGVAAGLTTLELLRADDEKYYRDLDDRQRVLVNGLRERAAAKDIPLLIQGVRGVLWVMFTDREQAFSAQDLTDIDRDRQFAFRVNLANEGILTFWGGRMFLSGLHTEQDIADTLDAAERAFATL